MRAFALDELVPDFARRRADGQNGNGSDAQGYEVAGRNLNVLPTEPSGVTSSSHRHALQTTRSLDGRRSLVGRSIGTISTLLRAFDAGDPTRAIRSASSKVSFSSRR